MAYQSALDFHGSNPVAGDIYDVVDTAHDPEVTVLIAARTVTGEVNPFDIAPVLLLEAVRVPIDCSHHRRPRTFQDKESAFVGANRFPASIDDIRDDPWQWPRCGAGFRRHRAWNRRDHYRSRFGLPPCIHDRA